MCLCGEIKTKRIDTYKHSREKNFLFKKISDTQSYVYLCAYVVK